MVNHPNRKANKIDLNTLKTSLVKVTAKIKKRQLCTRNMWDGRTLHSILFVADWPSKIIYVTVQGRAYEYGYRVRDGLDELFGVESMFPEGRDESEILGITWGEPGVTSHTYDDLYQEYILDLAKCAQEVLDNAPKGVEISDEIKAEVREVLEPYPRREICYERYKIYD